MTQSSQSVYEADIPEDDDDFNIGSESSITSNHSLISFNRGAESAVEAFRSFVIA